MTKPKIMLVDDSALVLDVVGDTLRRAGYDVIARSVAVGTGAAILRERPILALLDVSMPLMSGTEISRAIQGSSVARTTWVVLHSDRPEHELQELVERCGADGYIRKTGDSRRLLEAVQSWIARGRPAANAGYVLVACGRATRERLSRELEVTLPVRFTDSGTQALRQACSKDAPAVVAIGTSVSDLSPEMVYRSAQRSDPRWRSRFLLIEESVAPERIAGPLAELPRWSCADPVSQLASMLGALVSKS